MSEVFALGNDPLVLAAVAAVGVLMAVYGLTWLRQPGLVAQRLGAADRTPRSLEELELQRSFHDRVMWPILRGFSGLVLRYTPSATLENIRLRLILAGNPGGLEVRDFLGIKGLAAIGPTALYLAACGMFGATALPVVVLLLVAVGFCAPDFILRRAIRQRQRDILRALPDTLDLLTICVEAGLGFDAAVSRVVEKHDDELSREFGRVLSEMRMGRSRREALRSLAERTDVQDVNTFISAIVQSEQLGVSISKVLMTQAEQMRIRRRQRAEEQAHKAPIKMLFPMVFLIFPAMFVVILGPAMPGIMKAFS